MTSGPPLAGRVALVTGGARGIGLACAQGLSAAGAGVVIVDRLAQEAQAAARLIAAGGSRAVAIVADLAKIQEIPRTVAATSPYPASTSAVTGIRTARTMRPTAAAISSRPSLWPSDTPRE